MSETHTKRAIKTEAAAAAVGPYSQGIAAHGMVFASGQLPLMPDGTMAQGIEAQTKQSLANLRAVLGAGGATLDDVVKTTVFLKDMNDFAAMNAVYATQFTSVPPARSTVEVARLPRDALVEVEAIAIIAPK